MKSRTGAALLIALTVLVALAPGLAWANLAVTNLSVGRDAGDAPGATRFPPGTRSVFARFDYADASDHQIGLLVMVHGGVIGFGTSGRYNGSGSESVEISGSGVFRSVSAEVVQAARTARTNAEKAATQQFGLAEYLIQVEAGLNRVNSALVVLRGIDSPTVDQALLGSLEDASRMTYSLLERAARAGDDQQRREYAAAMDEPLGELMTSALALSAAADGAADVPLPASDGVWQYVVSVSVDGSPALTTEFEVTGVSIYVPSVSK
jgi:hypothetical protein